MDPAVDGVRDTEADARERIAFAEAAWALAGHEVTDPYLNDLAARQARGELSGEEARQLGLQHITGR